MSNNTSSIVSKVWSFCNPLRDVGVGYGDYLEQLTYLLFLKMADEYSKPPYNRKLNIPKEYDWESLTGTKGAALELHYVALLRELSTQKGILGQIFTKSQNKIQDPAMLAKIIDMIDSEQWLVMGADVKGDIYEKLLEQNAQDVKSGAGQYFTPRPLIRAMVECIQPQPMKTIADPACGTGGFFLAAYDYLVANNKLDKDQNKFIKLQTFYGNEIVAGTRRLALMNMFLHNIGDIDSDNFISPADALIAASPITYDYVLANPPFGKKSSQTFTNDEGEQEKDDLTYNRQDFWATTSNKQLNFVQHIRSMLKTTGVAAVVVPDNVLFEGGAGETVRKKLLETTDVHTILRLPTGIFYAQGVKANVIFFDNKPASKDPWTKEIWVYDYRINVHHTLKKNPLKLDDLKDFIKCYNSSNRHKRKETFNAETNPEGQWRKFSYEEIINRDKTSLDITWLKDKSLADLDNLPDPETIADEIFAFVLMPFLNEFTDVYQLGIKETAKTLNILAERVDEQNFHERILERIYNQIDLADIIIADMTGKNPNVFYEVGYAHAKKKLCILLTKESTDIPFDLQHHRHIIYNGSISILKEKLLESLTWAKVEVENFKRSRIRIKTKSIIGELEKTKYTSTCIIDFRIDLYNDSDSASEEIEALYFYCGNDWKITQNGINCDKGESDIESYKFLYLLTSPRNKIPKKSWLPLKFKVERVVEDAFKGNILKDSYKIAGMAVLRIVTSSGKFDHQLQIDLIVSEDLPF